MNRKSILIVDDDPRAIKALKAFLGPENYNVLEALDGKQALRIASERCPDLILLDVVMPGMNGFEVCKALKRDRKTKDIQVIFMTTYTDDETTKGTFMSGELKPVSRIELLSRIRSALDQQEIIKKALEKERLNGGPENGQGDLS